MKEKYIGRVNFQVKTNKRENIQKYSINYMNTQEFQQKMVLDH